MTPPVLIVEKHQPGGREELLAAGCAAEMGWHVEWGMLKNLRRNRIDVASADLVVGSIPFVLTSLRQRGVSEIADDCYPEVLRPYLLRDVRKAKLRQVIAHAEGYGAPLFVKPATRTKRFTGFVLDTPFDPRLGGVPSSEDVWACDPVDWCSEWRAYVVDGVVEHLSFCEGDRDVVPDLTIIRRAAAELAEDPLSPSACALDFGVLADGRTALVEMNDGFSLGAYEDVPKEVYFGLLLSRWRQLADSGADLVWLPCRQ